MNPIKNVMVQAMDSDQKWYEDRNDDLIESKWVNEDGTFEIAFDKGRFKDSILEKKPEVYLIVRNSLGQIIYTAEPKQEIEENGSDHQKSYILKLC